MTEAEWLACRDPERLACEPIIPWSERKWRLFACACARSVWHLITDARCRDGIECAERFADGAASEVELEEAEEAAFAAPVRQGPSSKHASAAAAAGYAAHEISAAVGALNSIVNAAQAAESPIHEQEQQCALLRDIIGNPFCLHDFDPGWRTDLSFDLAQTAYVERIVPSGELDNARLCVLADALEEANCTDAELLAHLRSPSPHVRGCWALDLILGKE